MRFIDSRALLFLGVLLFGCGPDFDPPDQLHSLRVLGVQKDLPYAKPGQTVNLQMLWEDASPTAGRNVQTVWSGPCFDPPGDLYYGCFSQPSVIAGLTSAATTSFKMPADIIRPATTENNSPYGIAYVFFAACAGTLMPIKTSDATAFPLGCEDDAGNLLGSDDFVAGYTSIYSYQKFSNNNPVISGFEFNGQHLANAAFCGPTLPDTDPADQPADCVPVAEAGPPDPSSIDCTDPAQAVRCIPTCADDGKSSCHGYAIRPTVNQADNQDQDAVSAQQLGHPTGEQMWIDYYTDGGGFKSPVRLLNDATAGWNDNYGTELYASKDAKISRIWALVHDNRGGVSWAGTMLKTE
jgi:hypothetical protein